MSSALNLTRRKPRPEFDAVEVQAYVTGVKTIDAILIRANTGGCERDVWVPRSVIHRTNKLKLEGGERGLLAVKGWFAKKESLR